jgi:DNA-binding MarR family transcriptional regulator
MQQKKPDTTHHDSVEIEALRAQLRVLMRHLEHFDHLHVTQGQTLPPSYAQALMVLLSYHETQQQPTLTELVELLNIDKSNVTRLCQRMQEDGHLLITRDARDRRAKRIKLSAIGVTLAQEVNKVSIERFGQLAQRLHDVSGLHDLLKQLNTSLEALRR